MSRRGGYNTQPMMTTVNRFDALQDNDGYEGYQRPRRGGASVWHSMRGGGRLNRQDQFRLDRRQQRDIQRAILNNVDEDDFDTQDAGEGAQAPNPPRRTRGRFMGGRGGMSRGGQTNRFARGEPRAQWNEIKILHGARMPKKTLYETVQEYVEGDFIPLNYRQQGPDAVFFIESEEIADQIRAMKNRLKDSRGRTMQIFVTQKHAPFARLPAAEIDAIKQAVARRYDAQARVLDLSDFANDPALNVHPSAPSMALTKNDVMVTVAHAARLIASDAIAVKASKNRLNNLDFFSNLTWVLPSVAGLDLSGNAMTTVRELNKLKDWQLCELNVDENPLCTGYTDRSRYIRTQLEGKSIRIELTLCSDVHAIFPRVTRLDEHTIEASAGFGIDKSDLKQETQQVAQCPQFKDSFLVDEGVKGLVVNFVDTYLALYDGNVEKRQELHVAYDDKATFTFACQSIDAAYIRFSDKELEKRYRRDSHNIVAEMNWSRYREKLVHQGKVAVVAALMNLPATRHDRSSLLVDVSFADANLLVLTLHGLFTDDGKKIDNPTFSPGEELRYFSRVFVIRHGLENGAYKIINEMFLLAASSADTVAAYRMRLSRARQTEQRAPTPPDPTMAAMPQMNREAMVQQFANESGLLPEWAAKCLTDYNFDWAQAMKAFNGLRHQIPSEAWAPGRAPTM